MARVWILSGLLDRGVYSSLRIIDVNLMRCSYETARKIKHSQDEYCAKALSNQWNDLGAFPEDLQWEVLVDVLRGRVKVKPSCLYSNPNINTTMQVHTHCYEAVDLDGLVRVCLLPDALRHPELI